LNCFSQGGGVGVPLCKIALGAGSNNDIITITNLFIREFVQG
jgi:hypothetical protein